MNNVVVSIIVPVYNVEMYLKHCIESLLNQTYENIDILLINDGSTDSSGKICDEYGRKYSKIKVYHKSNTGLGLTRNYGIERATGKYIVFVDSDDYLDKNIIETMVNRAETENLDFVTCGFTKVDNDGNILQMEKYNEENFFGNDVKDCLLTRMIGSCPEKKDSIFITAWCNLYLADIIKKNKLFFHSERELQGEDVVFQFDYLPLCKQALVLSENGYYYRTNPNSLALKYKCNRFEEFKKVYDYVENKIKELDLPSSANLRLCKLFFVQIKKIIKQEIPDISGKNKKDSITRVNSILEDTLTRKVISIYPINKLKIKQKIFVYMLKYKMTRLLLYIIRKI